ncbi:hypothetical protein OAT10_00305 [Luminiphilus sp.]|nr:hypothetical protein [Luminiphilus sp.]
MIFFKKILAFFKNYWYTPIIILGLITGYFFINGGGVKKFKSILNAAKRRYQKDKEDIEKIERDKNDKKNEIINETFRELKDLQKDKDAGLSDLERKKQNSIDNRIERYNEDSDDFTKEVGEFFDFNIFTDDSHASDNGTRKRKEALYKKSKEGGESPL